MRIAGMVAALALAGASSASATDLSGDYAFEGSCPASNPAYRGVLTIRTNGLFHWLVWRDGAGGTITGNGLERDGRMVVEYRLDDGRSGLMDMVRDGRRWRGTWATYGTAELCTETWTPR